MENQQFSIPVDSGQFSAFIERSKIFDRTREIMRGYLTNWYSDNAETFTEDMRADLTTVLEQYHFYNAFVSIDKNFNFDPPLDTVTCTIRIADEEDDYCSQYSAIYDFHLNAIDDYMRG
ncbi:MAG: hypothetical protein HFF49_01375 [Lawsonibacter sp.]|nr:hypothetical protein [Lawsonibacter sp.]